MHKNKIYPCIYASYSIYIDRFNWYFKGRIILKFYNYFTVIFFRINMPIFAVLKIGEK